MAENSELTVAGGKLSIVKNNIGINFNNSTLNICNGARGIAFSLVNNQKGIVFSGGTNSLNIDKASIYLSGVGNIGFIEILGGTNNISLKNSDISIILTSALKDFITINGDESKTDITFDNVRTNMGGLKFLSNNNESDVDINLKNSTIAGEIKQNSSGKINLSMENGSKWTRTGSSVINELKTDGTATIGLTAKEDEVGKLTITNKLDGSAVLTVEDLGYTGDANTINVVDLELAEIVEGSTIVLNGNNVNLGAYSYNLSNQTTLSLKNYYLVKEGYNEVYQTMSNVPSVLNAVVSAGLNSLTRRLGDIRRTPKENLNGVWARGYGRNDKFDNDIETKMEMTGVEGGYDRQVLNDKKDRYYVGAMVGYQNINKIKTEGAKSKFDGEGSAPSAGVYATWIAENGLFADITVRNFWINLDITGSDGMTKQKYKPYINQIAASVEFGKAFEIEMGNNSNVVIEPKTEWVYGYGRKTNCGPIEYGETQSIKGKLGIMLALNQKTQNDLNVQPYLEAGYNYEFDNKTDISWNGSGKTTRDLSGGYGDVGAGINAYLGSGVSCYSLVSYEKGSDQENILWNVGIRYGF